MKVLKTLGVLLGLVIVLTAGFALGFEFLKPYVMPHLPGGLAGDLEAASRPLQPIEQLISAGVILVILNWIFKLSKWLHKGINLFVNAPLALGVIAVSGYGAYGAYLAGAVPSPERLGLMLALAVLGLFWLLISLKVNVLGRHLFHPVDWAARKKKVSAVVEEVKEQLGVDAEDEEVAV